MEGHALQQLKVALLEAPVIIPPNPDKPFFLVTDASDCAIGASVEQEEGEGNRHRAVAVSLHSLNPAERKYPVHERESLAIVLALRTWRVHLYGSEFPVYCHNDHRSLHHFLTHSNLSPRQVRWQQLLFEYNLTVAYVPGKSNAFAVEPRDVHDLMIHKTFLSFMMSFKYHSDWEDLVPSMLYAYHNTVHSDNGFTPHELLFGWWPQDLRVPFATTELDKTNIAKNVDAWLQRNAELQKAQVHLEYARAAMIKARKSAASPRTYAVGDQVKISTRVLPLRAACTQSEKLQPR
jgi:hypothetical protein